VSLPPVRMVPCCNMLMEITIAPCNFLILFAAMATLAAVPGISVMAVVARAASLGFVHGAVTALGIVAGDVVFILIAALGLAAMADFLGAFFAVIRIAGGLYLIGLGVAMWRAAEAAGAPGGAHTPEGASLWSGFLLGLFITLGDQKAVVFYLGFLPAFVDLAQITPADTGLLVLTAATALLGAKLAYAAAAVRAGAPLENQGMRGMRRAAGGVLAALGVCLLLNLL